MQALHAFRDNKTSFLIATPQAARGLDMPAVSHVYNLDVPEDAVTYLHRSGRTGRIGSPVKGTTARRRRGYICHENSHFQFFLQGKVLSL